MVGMKAEGMVGPYDSEPKVEGLIKLIKHPKTQALTPAS